jgi:hypothetical protein
MDNTDWHIPQSSVVDHEWMVYNADLSEHFSSPKFFENGGYASLLKNMSFPLFMAVTHQIGLPFAWGIIIITVVAALISAKIFSNFTKSSIGKYLIFIAIMFNPIQFCNDLEGYNFIYRDRIFYPTTVIICMIGIKCLLLIYRGANWKKILSWTLPFSLTFTFCYYITESGVFLWIFVIFISLFTILVAIKRRNWRIIPHALGPFLLVSITVFCGLTSAYKAINYYSFGVSTINNRTEGALAEFANNLYKLRDDKRVDNKCWASPDAYNRALSVSTTLASKNEYFNELNHNGYGCWDADYNAWAILFFNPIHFDGNNKYAELEQFFNQVNQELDYAIKTGGVELDTNGFQVLQSLPPRSLKSYLARFKPFAVQLKRQLLFESTQLESTYDKMPSSVAQSVSSSEFITNSQILHPDKIRQITGIEPKNQFEQKLSDICDNFKSTLVKLAHYAQYFLLLLCLLSLLVMVIYMGKNRQRGQNTFVAFLVLMLVSIGSAVDYGVILFGVAGPDKPFTYAGQGATCFCIAELLLLVLLSENLRHSRNRRVAHLEVETRDEQLG